MIRAQFNLNVFAEAIVDFFCGGGGVSEAFELALCRNVEFALNHNPKAISMHRVNHPQTVHLEADVHDIDPRKLMEGRPVGWFHMSPDCTHFSQASAGQPRSRTIRSLAWVGKRWAGTVKPRILSAENVESIQSWGPLIAKRDKATGRVIKADGTVAAKGEYVPLREQFLVPDPKRAGQTWNRFVAQLRALGYQVEWKVISAAGYGAATSRERLFMLARCDGKPINWPEPSHAKEPKRGQKVQLMGADIIDWAIPSKSIFDRKRPLAEATMRRIARGIMKYVVDHGDPFIVPIAHFNGRDTVHSLREPLKTITAWPKGGAFALSTPVLAKIAEGGKLVDGAEQILKNLDLAHFMRSGDSGGHLALGSASNDELPEAFDDTLTREVRAGALRVASFVMKFYKSGGQWGDLRDPLATITTKDRLALVTVVLDGASYLIVDIGLRMLTPRELYRAQGFPDNYIIEYGADGERFNKAEQVHMVGNSVSPLPMAALIRANGRDLGAWSSEREAFAMAA